MDNFIGKYQHLKSENLDAYFKGVGVPFMIRIMITKSNPDLEITKTDDTWNIAIKSMLRTSEKIFKLGEEFEEQMPGKKLKSTAKYEDGKIIIESTSEDDVKSTSIYEFEGSELVMTLIHEGSGASAKRYFKRI